MSDANYFSEKLTSILTNICQGVELPQIHEPSEAHKAEKFVEQIELKNYPYSPIVCTHQEMLGIGEDCTDCQSLQYETYKSRFLSLAKEQGFDTTHTLHAAFEYYSSLITQYRLTECDHLLDSIYQACMARGKWSIFYLMAIQARAFLRFKQGQYEESIKYFEEQLALIGPNERIYENMALAYSRLNNNKEASICYAKAILLIQRKPAEEQQFSTLLLGLSTVLTSAEEALTVLETSLSLLKMKYDKPHSLMAKTLGAMGDLYHKQNELKNAEHCYAEAVQIFIDTCGYETPLTSNAFNKHGKSLLLLNEPDKALHAYHEALKIWVKVDNASFDPNMVVEALLSFIKNQEILSNQIKNSPNIPQSKNTIKRNLNAYSSNSIKLKDLIDTLESLQNKILNNASLKNDINSLCLLKFIYELFLLNKEIPRATYCCKTFIENLEQLDNCADDIIPYRDKLIKETSEILKLLKTIKFS